MSYDAWTLYSPKVDYSIAAYAKELLPGATLETYDDPTSWETASLVGPHGEVTLHACRAEGEGDKFSRLMDGTRKWLDEESGFPKDKRERVSAFLADVRMLIGVVGKPAIDGATKQAVHVLARRLGAKIFDNVDFVDP